MALNSLRCFGNIDSHEHVNNLQPICDNSFARIDPGLKPEIYALLNEALLLLANVAEKALFNHSDSAKRLFQALHKLRGHYLEMRERKRVCGFLNTRWRVRFL